MSEMEYTLPVKSCLWAHTGKAKPRRDKVPGKNRYACPGHGSK